MRPVSIIYDKYADKVTLIDFGTSKIKTVMDSETTMPLDVYKRQGLMFLGNAVIQKQRQVQERADRGKARLISCLLYTSRCV